MLSANQHGEIFSCILLGVLRDEVIGYRIVVGLKDKETV